MLACPETQLCVKLKTYDSTDTPQLFICSRGVNLLCITEEQTKNRNDQELSLWCSSRIHHHISPSSLHTDGFKLQFVLTSIESTNTQTQPRRKCSRRHFSMFLAKLWLLLLMTTTKHVETHTHSRAHTHTTWRQFPEGMLHGCLPLLLRLPPAADWGQSDACFHLNPWRKTPPKTA